jgi:hypothetical protein
LSPVTTISATAARRFLQRARAWIWPLAIAACSPPPPAAPPRPSPLTASIRFTHAYGDRWTAEYELSAPVRAVGYRRPRTSRARWRVIEPEGVTLSGSFVVGRAPFQRFVVELPTTTEQPEKEYRAFYRYTDRGMLAYTGQLGIEHAICAEGTCEGGRGLAHGAGIPGTLTLAAGPGEHVVVRGQPPRPAASVAIGEEDDGTYAYFGDLAPIETAHFVGVVDEALPAWLRDRTVSDLPRIFALYSERLGPLTGDDRPTAFLTFAALDRERGRSIGGGVLHPRVLNLDVELGRAYLAGESPALLADIDHLVAHEGAHFWNSDQFPHHGGEGSDWLPEGTADALALRARHALGALDDAAYVGALEGAASQCALWLSDGAPLTSSTRRGHARAFYACGATLALVAEAAVKRRRPDADLFTLWRAVFAEARPGYDEALFARALGDLSGDPEVVESVRRLAHEPLADATEAIRSALRHVGVETAARGAPGVLPDDYEQHASIPAVEALLPRACVGALDFPGDSEVTPMVTVDQACPGLSKGDVIASLEGVPLGPRGATAYALAYEACRTRQRVDVVTAKKAHFEVPCAPDPRPPPAYFAITRLP